MRSVPSLPVYIRLRYTPHLLTSQLPPPRFLTSHTSHLTPHTSLKMLEAVKMPLICRSHTLTPHASHLIKPHPSPLSPQQVSVDFELRENSTRQPVGVARIPLLPLLEQVAVRGTSNQHHSTSLALCTFALCTCSPPRLVHMLPAVAAPCRRCSCSPPSLL